MTVQKLGYDNWKAFADEGGLMVFTSAYCGPCRALKPVLAEYAQQGGKVGVVDLDESPDLFTAADIKALPTIIAIKDNKEYGRRSGSARLADLKKLAG